MLSPRGHPAYYPQPILYWSYPSPPGSPNTYFATHTSSPHLNHNGLASPQPGLVRSGHTRSTVNYNLLLLQFPVEFIPPPGAALQPQFSPRPPSQHMHHNGTMLSGNSPHPHMPFQHQQQQHHHHPLSPHNGPPMIDINNNAMHMYNQPSLLLATPLNPGQQYPSLPAPQQVHSSASSETGPAESESTTPTSGSCSGESTLSSNSESIQNLAAVGSQPFFNGGSHQQQQPQQQQFYQHQSGIIATQLADDLQAKMNTLASNQYVSLFIV